MLLQATWWWSDIWSFWQPVASCFEEAPLWSSSFIKKCPKSCHTGWWLSATFDCSRTRIQKAHWWFYQLFQRASWSLRGCCNVLTCAVAWLTFNFVVMIDATNNSFTLNKYTHMHAHIDMCLMYSVFEFIFHPFFSPF